MGDWAERRQELESIEKVILKTAEKLIMQIRCAHCGKQSTLVLNPVTNAVLQHSFTAPTNPQAVARCARDGHDWRPHPYDPYLSLTALLAQLDREEQQTRQLSRILDELSNEYPL